MMRRIIPIIILLVLLLPPLTANSQLVDRVVAEVNGEVLTLSELEREMAAVRQQVLAQVAEADHESALTEARRQVLAGMIDRLLVEQHANKRGLRVGEREVDEAVQQLLGENQLTMDEFIRDLARNNVTLAAYRRDLRAQILQARVLNLEVRERIVIPETRLREYYREYYQGKQESEAYHILQMGFSWSSADEAGRQEARERAEAARSEVVAGGDFRAIAYRRSDLPSGSDGGDLGVFRRDELAGVMQEAIPRLAPGEISPLLETPAGYQFFQLLSDRGDRRSQLSFEEAREEIRELLYRQALENQFTRWVSNLRQEAYIKVRL